jgi:hypothetical protein
VRHHQAENLFWFGADRHSNSDFTRAIRHSVTHQTVNSDRFRAAAHCFRTLSLVVLDLVRLASLAAHSRSALAAENLFLRKQLALFQERKIKPRRADDSTRWLMVTLSRMFPWRDGW